jgi:DNA-binding response OmpR family regulator
VIIVSSSDEEKNARDLGAQDYVKKPINFAKLFGVLQEIKQRTGKVIK